MSIATLYHVTLVKLAGRAVSGSDQALVDQERDDSEGDGFVEV